MIKKGDLVTIYNVQNSKDVEVVVDYVKVDDDEEVKFGYTYDGEKFWGYADEAE